MIQAIINDYDRSRTSLVQHRAKLLTDSYIKAAENGHLNILEYAISTGLLRITDNQDKAPIHTYIYTYIGVSRRANLKAIKKAYREKALEWHPVMFSAFIHAYIHTYCTYIHTYIHTFTQL